MASGASALPVDPTFVAAGGANERLEFRGGKLAAADWEIGLGANTQIAGQFAKAQGPYTDSSRIIDWEVGTAYDFTYAIDSALNATFTMGNISLTWGGMDLGNTLQFHAKQEVSVTLDNVTATGVLGDKWGTDYRYLTIDPVNGFSLTGSIKFNSAATGSGNGVIIQTGNRPASVPDGGVTAGLLGVALMGMAAFRRRMAA